MKIIVLISSVFVASSLLATELPPRGPLSFEMYDKNHDNVITEQEFNDVRTARMNANAQAGRAMRNAGKGPEFSFFDANKDGKIDKAEFEKAQQTLPNRQRR